METESTRDEEDGEGRWKQRTRDEEDGEGRGRWKQRGPGMKRRRVSGAVRNVQTNLAGCGRCHSGVVSVSA